MSAIASNRSVVSAFSSLLFASVCLLTPHPLWAGLDTGMVLLHTRDDAGYGDDGRLEVLYLSTDRIVVIQDGGVRDAVFSPDGSKIAYFSSIDGAGGQELYSVNVDGTDKARIYDGTFEGGARAPQWCSDGWIYYNEAGDPWINRIPAAGGSPETIHHSAPTITANNGGTVDGGLGGLHMSLDGTRSTSTALGQFTARDGRQYSSYAQKNIDLTTGDEYSWVAPCQGSLSPDGTRISVSTYGHRVYRIVDWGIPYIDYGPNVGDTYFGCEAEGTEYDRGGSSAFTCPDYHPSLLLGLDLHEMFSLPNTWESIPEIGGPRFSNTDEDIFLFWTESPVNETSAGAWLRVVSTGEYIKLGPMPTHPLDYVRAETVAGTQVFTLTPTSTVFNVQPGSPLPAAKTVTFGAQTDLSAAPAISGVPGWLRVDAAPSGARAYELSNSLVETNLPGEGTHTAAITVTPAQSTTGLTYEVSLIVDAVVEPIVIHSPTGGEGYTVGDTLRVRYSADAQLMSGTIVSLSINEGETFRLLHSDASYAAGDNVELEYVLRAEDLASDPRGSSDKCMVRVSAYPSGYDTYSALFSIAALSNAAAADATLALPRAFTASVVRTVSGAELNVTAPSIGTVRVIDMRGRATPAFAVTRGEHGIDLGTLDSGRYLVAFRNRGGRWDGMMVTY
ncbi:MAG: hypothetical protein GF331_07750 [Chitinivibrionales bacterium]|nr:hypothetical protein [Chitinivibrionales bacterium]